MNDAAECNVTHCFTLVTGRTREQGLALHQGKDSEIYRQATAWVEVGREEMARLGIEEGQVVRLRTSAGEVRVPVHAGNLPPRLLFMPMGPTASLLVETDTGGTGMPLFKRMAATLEVV
jgi:formylmethanofuran dehydrogenase subunit D